MTDATGTADTDLGQVAYEAESDLLAEFLPHFSRRDPPWDALDAEYRRVYQRIAGAVAVAERDRLAALLDDHGHELARQAHSLLNSASPEDKARGVREGDMATALLEAAALIREAGK